MVRGYDVLFQNKLLGALIVIAALFLISALCAWGALYFKGLKQKDEAMRRSLRKQKVSVNSEPLDSE